MANPNPNANHPRRGSSIKVQPIRSEAAIQQIKDNLKDQPRNLCLFTMGINTAYRANELLSLTIGQVIDLQAGDLLDIKQSKTKKYRPTVINDVTYKAIQYWLLYHPKGKDRNAPLFLSQRRGQSLTVSAVIGLVKAWCKDAGLSGNYGSHSLRKTWGYHQRIKNNASVPVLMRAFKHKTEAQTLDYLCIVPVEICTLYKTLQL